jgi:hypothetical protein
MIRHHLIALLVTVVVLVAQPTRADVDHSGWQAATRPISGFQDNATLPAARCTSPADDGLEWRSSTPAPATVPEASSLSLLLLGAAALLASQSLRRRVN